MAQPTDFYAVLGVPRSADDREIKRAYFRLVRQFSPEAHPEEFKRIREAYEILGNAESRREYDNVSQYGEEIGGHLRAGMEAMDRGDLRQAQADFRHVLTLQPGLHYARDLLGMAYLNDNQPREALSQFNLLVAAEERSAVYHLHRGYAYYALDQYPEALAAYSRARELDGKDTRILVALADCYTAMDRYDDALRELDRAIEVGGALDFQDYVFFMRKVQIQLLRDRADLAEQEIDRLCRVLPDDLEVRKHVAQKLGALAAQLFRIKRSADGNRLLRRARRLEAGTRAPLSFPAKVSRRLADLPRASRDRLEQLGREPSPQRLVHGIWTGPVLLLVLALTVLGGGVLEALTARHAWQGTNLAFMLTVLAAGPVLVLLAVRRLLRAARSRVGRFTTIHPLYLLQVDVDRLTAWPLVNLHDVSMTHHLQNGVYQYTAVKADFAGAQLTLTIRGQQAAVEWAQALLDARHRCLGLLSVGMLEEEEGVDLLPPDVLERPAPWPAPAARRGLLLQYGAAAAAGVSLASGGAWLNNRLADEASWEAAAAAGGRAFGLRHYLLRHPGGRHAAEARLRLGRIYEEAKVRYLQQVGDAPGREAIAQVLDALKDAPTQEVWVRYRSSIDLHGVREQQLPAGAQPIAPERAFSAAENRRREVLITQGLAGAFQRVLPEDLLSLTAAPDPDEGIRYHRRGVVRRPAPAVIFDVSYRVTPSGELYRSTSDRSALYGIQLAWTLQIRTPGTGVPYTVELVSQPAQSIRYLRPSFEDEEIVPYTKMAESAFEEFSRKVAREFGVTITPPRHRYLDGRVLSPDARRVLQDLGRRRGLTPTALEEMERILRARSQSEEPEERR